MSREEGILEEHLSRDDFQEGVRLGKWRIVKNQFPRLFASIMAKDNREWYFSFHCPDYPTGRPNALLRTEDGEPMAPGNWPKGKSGDGEVMHVFRLWERGAGGRRGLYHPCDQAVQAEKKDWPEKYPNKTWAASVGIVRYFAELHRLLNCEDYDESA